MWDLLFKTFPRSLGEMEVEIVYGYLWMYPCPLHLRDAEASGLAAALSPKGNTPPLQQREPHIHI